MPITITKVMLSGSTHGQGIGISNTQGGTPQTIHALGTTATTTVDEIYLYAQNDHSQAGEILLEWGTSASTSNNNSLMTIQVPPRDGPTLIVPGLPLMVSACSVRAFVSGYTSGCYAGSPWASSAFIAVFGYVNRIVQT